MATVCQTCGGKSFTDLLICCVQCQVSAVHHYCLEKFSPDDKEVIWICEECVPKVAKLGPSRRSERRSSRKNRNAEVRMNRKKRQYKSGSPTGKEPGSMKDRMPEAAQLTGDCSLLNEEMKTLHSFNETCGNQELKNRRRLVLEDGGSSDDEFESIKAAQLTDDCSLLNEAMETLHSFNETCGSQELKKQRRLVLEDGGGSDEEFEPFKAEASQLDPYNLDGPSNIAYCQPSLESHDYIHAQPIVDPVWRGCFSIGNRNNGTFVGLVGRLSTEACPKVSDVATELPQLLDVEILPRSDAWPKSFQISPPKDDSIALYFFPEYERDEKVFDGLLDDIIDQDLALKAVINNVELLVFSSLELPQKHWRFLRKYYLWGVFRQKQDALPLKPTGRCLVQNSIAERVISSKLTNDVGSQEERDFFKNKSTWSPHSSLSTGSSYMSDPPYSPFHPKA